MMDSLPPPIDTLAWTWQGKRTFSETFSLFAIILTNYVLMTIEFDHNNY